MQRPALSDTRRDPLTAQNLRDPDATDRDTFEPRGIVNFAKAAIRADVRPERLTTGATARTTVLEVDVVVVEVVVVVAGIVVVVVVVLVVVVVEVVVVAGGVSSTTDM